MNDPRFIHLSDPHEFDTRFIEKTRECDTQEEAYQQVEEEYKKTFGTTKYANFESFYRAWRTRLKKKISSSKN